MSYLKTKTHKMLRAKLMGWLLLGVIFLVVFGTASRGEAALIKFDVNDFGVADGATGDLTGTFIMNFDNFALSNFMFEVITSPTTTANWNPGNATQTTIQLNQFVLSKSATDLFRGRIVDGSPWSQTGGEFAWFANGLQGTATYFNPEPVPEPSSLLLMGTGLLATGIYMWRRKGIHQS